MDFTLTRPQIDVLLGLIPTKDVRNVLQHLNIEWTTSELRLIATNSHCIAVHRRLVAFDQPGSMAIAVGSIQAVRSAMRKKTDIATIRLDVQARPMQATATLNNGDAVFKLVASDMTLGRYKDAIRAAVTRKAGTGEHASHGIIPEYAVQADQFVNEFGPDKRSCYLPIRVPGTDAWVTRDEYNIFLMLGFVSDVYSDSGDVTDIVGDY